MCETMSKSLATPLKRNSATHRNYYNRIVFIAQLRQLFIYSHHYDACYSVSSQPDLLAKSAYVRQDAKWRKLTARTYPWRPVSSSSASEVGLYVIDRTACPLQLPAFSDNAFNNRRSLSRMIVNVINPPCVMSINVRSLLASCLTVVSTNKPHTRMLALFGYDKR